jgi:hypothetical protein
LIKVIEKNVKNTGEGEALLPLCLRILLSQFHPLNTLVSPIYKNGIIIKICDLIANIIKKK